MSTVGQFEQYTHQATLIFLDDQANTLALLEETYLYMEAQQNLTFGVSQTAFPGFVLRILGQSAEQLFACLQEVGTRLKRHMVLQPKPINSIPHQNVPAI